MATRGHDVVRNDGLDGYPVEVFLCQENAYYNATAATRNSSSTTCRSTKIALSSHPSTGSSDLNRTVVYKSEPDWAGPLSKIYRNGTDKVLGYNKDMAGLLQEISKDRVGYLVT